MQIWLQIMGEDGTCYKLRAGIITGYAIKQGNIIRIKSTSVAIGKIDL